MFLSYHVVILTNQGGLTLQVDPDFKGPKNLGKKRVAAFKQKCSAVFTHLDIPLTLYGATARDIYRKPRTGMWQEMSKDYNLLGEGDIDLENSIFVGDAGGRTVQLQDGKAIAKDFSCSDRNLAHNLGIRFQTPEEFFLDEPAREFARDFDLVQFPFDTDSETDIKFDKANDIDIVLFCGPPGAGKSTFYWKHLKPLGYERVNQDILKRLASLPPIPTHLLTSY
jgi:bifunctional polynucleotide phosphatase/kinase